MNLLHLDLEVRLKGSEIQSFKKQETTGSLSMLRMVSDQHQAKKLESQFYNKTKQSNTQRQQQN